MLEYGYSPPPTIHRIAVYSLFVWPVLLCPIVASICGRSTMRLGWKYVPMGIGVGVTTAATHCAASTFHSRNGSADTMLIGPIVT